MTTLAKISVSMLTSMLLAAAPASVQSREDASSELRRTFESWIAAINAGDRVAGLAAMTSDGAIISPAGPVSEGEEQLRERVGQLTSLPGFRVTMRQNHVSVGQDGRTGFVVSDGEITIPLSAGALQTTPHRLLTVWRKEGAVWRCYIDMPVPVQTGTTVHSGPMR